MKFLNNIRNRYSFNFLVFIGLVDLFTILVAIVLPKFNKIFDMFSEFILYPIWYLSFISILVAICLFLTEKNKITDEKFINSKFIFVCQLLGLLFVVLSVLSPIFPFLGNLMFLNNGLFDSQWNVPFIDY